MNLADIRKEYQLKELEESGLNNDPIAQFQLWLHDAITADVNEPTAMNLATVDGEGQPSSRIVLLKGMLNNTFRFFTNYESKKGNDLKNNNRAALNFFWPELERQVRINGIIEKLSDVESDEYFYSRPFESQLGAHASPQSAVIESRKILEKNIENIKNTYASALPRPIFWGGYALIPFYFEFWQGRASRLHDRLIYERVGDQWKIARLAP